MALSSRLNKQNVDREYSVGNEKANIQLGYLSILGSKCKTHLGLSWHHRDITFCVRIVKGRAQMVTQKHRQVVQRSRSDPKSAQG